jgi:hypothetical protein
VEYAFSWEENDLDALVKHEYTADGFRVVSVIPYYKIERANRRDEPDRLVPYAFNVVWERQTP